MITLILLALLGAAAAYSEVRGTMRLMALVKRLEPVQCYVCKAELDEPLMRIELSRGVIVCETCYEPIALEAHLEYPDWWYDELPAEGEAPKQIEEAPGDLGDWLRDADAEQRFKCDTCKEWHQGVASEHVCVEGLKKYDVETPPEPPKTYGCAGCGATRNLDEVCLCGLPGGHGGSFAINFTTGRLAVSEPRMNAVVVPAPPKDPDVRWCEPCKMDHRKHETCAFEVFRKLHPPVCKNKGCGATIVHIVPNQDQCNMCIMAGPPDYWLTTHKR